MPLFLVRHAKAGNKEKWDGADELRPVSSAGREQVEWITRRLGEFPIKRVLSSPLVRCVQTVQPLAAKVGVEVENEPALAEGEPAGPVIELLTELPDYSVLCTHGDIVPDTIGALERRGLVVQGPPDWRKGVVWEIDRVENLFLRARAIPPER
jgi:8-oxo-dGTP diphosphatase